MTLVATWIVTKMSTDKVLPSAPVTKLDVIIIVDLVSQYNIVFDLPSAKYQGLLVIIDKMLNPKIKRSLTQDTENKELIIFANSESQVKLITGLVMEFVI